MKLLHALLLSLMVFSNSIATAQKNVATTAPIKIDITRQLRFTGSTRPALEAFATSDVAGPVLKIMVEDGDQVKAGQTLAIIDPIRFEIAVRQSEADLKRAEQQKTQAKSDFERNETLFNRKAVSQTTLDSFETAYITAKASLKRTQNDLQIAKLDLERCRIISPIDGYFVERNVEIGQAINRGQIIGRVINLDEIRVAARIPQTEIRHIQTGQSCIIEDQYPGFIEQIGLYADQSRSFRIKARVKNPDLHFRDNMFVRGFIVIESWENVPAFDTRAVRSNENETWIFIVKDNKAIKKHVSIAARKDNLVYAPEVTKNDKIVIIGQDELEHGDTVIIRTDASN